MRHNFSIGAGKKDTSCHWVFGFFFGEVELLQESSLCQMEITKDDTSEG